MPKPSHRNSEALDIRAPVVPTKLTIVVPSYNEGSSLVKVVMSLIAVDCGIPKEIVIVDDGSTDGSIEPLDRYVLDGTIFLFRHPENLGKGAAICTGLERATGSHLVIFDADDEYNPSDLPRMVDALSRPRVNVVYGSRMHQNGTRHPSFIYYFGNRLMTFGANFLYGSALSDLHTCLKLFPVDLLRTFSLSQKGFGLDSEITAEMLRRGIRPFEVPVSYNGRSRLEGKKISFADSFTSVWILLKVKLRRN